MANHKRRYRLRWVDVFTERALAGNPLAVVLDPKDLTGEQMQAIARETNLSETTFMLPQEIVATRRTSGYLRRLWSCRSPVTSVVESARTN